MSFKAKSSQPSVASLLLLSVAISGSICLWCDREAKAKPDRQTQVKIVDSTVKLTKKLENLL